MALARVITAGTVLVDKINTISAYPKAGELTQIRALSRVCGGLVPNTGGDIAIATADIPVMAFGKVGADDDGRFVTRELAKRGMDVSGIITTSDAATSFTDVMSIPGGERTFFTYPGASADWGFDDIDFSKVGPGTLFHLGYFLLLDKVDAGDGLKILAEARKRGAETSIDLVSENSDRYRMVAECLPYVDHLIVNELEAARLAGLDPETPAEEVSRALMSAGVGKRVIIHRPSEGTCLERNGTFTRVKSFALPAGFVKGTTGAGDAYCAGALIGGVRGFSAEETLSFASMMAVAALSAPGATEGMRPEGDVRVLCADFARQM